MAMNSAALTAAGEGFRTAFPYLSIHTAGPVTSSADESTAARVPANWVNTNGTFTATDRAFTGGAPSGPAVRVGYWSAPSGGTYGGGSLLSGDPTFNTAGAYTVLSVTEEGSAT